MTTKVFGIGFHKTGTTSLDVALTTMGYKVCGHRLELAEDLFRNDLTRAFEITEQYDAFQDNPWPLLYRELDDRYPSSKFILTIRDNEKWIKSVTNHFRTTHTEMRRWIYGVGHPEGNEELYLAKYQKHNNDVVEYFKHRPDDLLIVSWENGDGWEKLCHFFGRPVPSVPFPHANKGRYSREAEWAGKGVFAKLLGRLRF